METWIKKQIWQFVVYKIDISLPKSDIGLEWNVGKQSCKQTG
jgi:hypothetical protein